MKVSLLIKQMYLFNKYSLMKNLLIALKIQISISVDRLKSLNADFVKMEITNYFKENNNVTKDNNLTANKPLTLS